MNPASVFNGWLHTQGFVQGLLNVACTHEVEKAYPEGLASNQLPINMRKQEIYKDVEALHTLM